jgi:hypothetical protein
MLTRYKGQLKLKDWAFGIAKRSTMRKARVALASGYGAPETMSIIASTMEVSQ